MMFKEKSKLLPGLVQMFCNCCGKEALELIYQSKALKSITTMNTQIDGELKVYLCENCAHCQTEPLGDLDRYYQVTYELGRLNEKDDQLYAKEGSELVYRAQHQAKVLVNTLNINSETKLLDFGCGKSLTLHNVCSDVKGFKPYLYDVSGKYMPIWLEITTRDRCAVANTPSEWRNTFDVVTSFYALEHIVELEQVCNRVWELLKEKGIFYFVIPNVLANPADFIVADHVNHFSSSSISAIMRRTGFDVRHIDITSHDGAIICVADKSLEAANDLTATEQFANPRDEEFNLEVRELAKLWKLQEGRLQDLINKIPETDKIAIYGAGFYGVFLANLLLQCDRKISHFIDVNPYLQGFCQLGADIIAPDFLPSDVMHVLVGLNPVKSKKIISEVECFQDKNINFIFIEAS